MSPLSTSTISPRQLHILILLYRFRFLTRLHIQLLLGHKNHRLVLSWLNDLTTQHYLNRDFAKQLAAEPALYSLTTKGRKYLKNLDDPVIKISVLNRVWRETNLSTEFKKECMFLADVYILLLTQSNTNNSTLHYSTKAELSGIPHLITPAPDAYVAIELQGSPTQRYFIDSFMDLPPRVLRARITAYHTYFESDEWHNNTDKPFPKILLICPNERLKKHLTYFIKSRLGELSELRLIVFTKDEIRAQGLQDLE
jgi:hypothetical protein